MEARWYQSEEERDLGLEYVRPAIWRDKTGRFYFNDETQSDICGPYASIREADEAMTEYADIVIFRLLCNS